jgi:hypothetical protein
MCGDSPGDFHLRFGRCYDADKCIVDPSCEFYTEHCQDADEYCALFSASEADADTPTDSGRETEATAQPDFTAGYSSASLSPRPRQGL